LQVDPVPVATFPRLLSTANFQLMAPLPHTIERQRLIEYTEPPKISSGHGQTASFSASRKSLKGLGKRLFSGGSRDETAKYEKLD
jgi:hypothetical protein